MFRKTLLALLLTASGLVHAQIPVSGLPPATTPLGANDKIIVNQPVSGTVYSTRQAPLSALAPFFPSINSHYILQAPDPLLPQSRTLVGTANQVTITDGGALGNLTLSLPQSICTACSPTFTGLTLTGALNGVSGIFSGTLQSAGYTGTTGLFSSTLQAASLSLTTPLQATSGGTGFGSYAVGDLLAASTTTALSKLSDVAAGSYLRSGGVNTLPLWSTLTLPNAATTGDLLVATATNTVGVIPAVGANRYLRSTGVGTAPIYSNSTIPNTVTLGDIWVGSGSNALTALGGNITSTQQFLSSTGNGASAFTPVWSTLPGSFSGFANPSGLIGLTAANGVATTGTRSDATHALDQSISPTWTGNHSFSNVVTSTASGSATVGGFFSNAAQPDVTLRASGGAVDSKVWDFTANTTDLLGRTLNDALSTAKIWIDVNRTANVITSLTLGNTIDQPTVFAHSAQLTVDNTATNFNPIAWCANGNAASNKCWSFRNGSGLDAGLYTADDAGVAQKSVFSAVRSGTAVSSIAIGNSTDKPPITLNGAVNIPAPSSGIPLTLNTTTVQSATFTGTNVSGGRVDFIDTATPRGYVGYGSTVISGTTNTDFNVAAGASGKLNFSANNGPSAFGTISTTGAWSFPSLSTTASAANAFLDNAAGNNLLRSTSSRRYKKDITTLVDPLNVVMKLRPVRFHSLASADSHTAWFYGLVAEEVAAVEPSLIVKDKLGRPDGVQYDRVQVFMLPVVQSMHRQIYWLWVCVFLLASWNVYLTFRKKQ